MDFLSFSIYFLWVFLPNLQWHIFTTTSLARLHSLRPPLLATLLFPLGVTLTRQPLKIDMDFFFLFNSDMSSTVSFLFRHSTLRPSSASPMHYPLLHQICCFSVLLFVLIFWFCCFVTWVIIFLYMSMFFLLWRLFQSKIISPHQRLRFERQFNKIWVKCNVICSITRYNKTIIIFKYANDLDGDKTNLYAYNLESKNKVQSFSPINSKEHSINVSWTQVCGKICWKWHVASHLIGLKWVQLNTICFLNLIASDLRYLIHLV